MGTCIREIKSVGETSIEVIAWILGGVTSFLALVGYIFGPTAPGRILLFLFLWFVLYYVSFFIVLIVITIIQTIEVAAQINILGALTEPEKGNIAEQVGVLVSFLVSIILSVPISTSDKER
ncbi:MAG TPA: hypothetical protein DCL48_04300 [Alphaproteobacteria bacterium]|nr:hypothetical protein [Alphaproteobacteria bacterium]